MAKFTYALTIETETKDQADQVIGERTGFDEDLGFDYQISNVGELTTNTYESYIEVVHGIGRGELDDELLDMLSAIDARRKTIEGRTF